MTFPEDEMCQCPECKHRFHYKVTFWWGLDGDGDPTVEHVYCPECHASTRPYDRRRKQYSFDDFTAKTP